MTKFNLLAFNNNRHELVDELQRFKYIHFSDTKDLAVEEELESVKVPESIEKNDGDLSKVEWLINLLEPRIKAKSALSNLKDGLDWYSIDELKAKGQEISFEDLYEELKAYAEEIDDHQQEIKAKETTIMELKPWENLEASLSDIVSSPNVNIITGTISNKKVDGAKEALASLDGTYLEVISKDSKLSYLIAIILKEEYNDAIEILRQNGFNNVLIPGQAKPIDEIRSLEEDIKAHQGKIESLNQIIGGHTDKLEDLKIKYEYLSNRRLELAAVENFAGVKGVDIVKGYVPTEKIDEFTKSLTSVLGNLYYLELEDADKKDDTTPVLLENNGLVKPFQSLTTMYSTPRYSEIDPTPFFFFFYWVFFGMMVADFGYGLLMTIVTGIVLKVFNLSEGFRNTVKFFFMLSISIMIWGLLYNSAFGVQMPYEPIIDSSNYTGMLILSIIMGGIHLFFGLGVKAYMYIRDGEPMNAVYDVLFWYMTLIGFAVFLLGILGIITGPITKIGLAVMVIGMVGIVLFGGRDAKSLPSRFVLGLYELYGISSWIGDFISYARLMALGLSGGFIAVAINMIMDMMPDGLVGLIPKVLIFLIGHGFNIFLSYLSAYVHDIRLTYVEFFGKFFEGGGRTFNLFKNDTKYINMK